MRLLLAATAALALAGPLAAQEVTATPQSVKDAMTREGIEVTQSTDDDGGAMLEGKMKGFGFAVYFFGCDTANTPCTSIKFSAGFDLDDPLDLSKVNEWNRDKRFGKIFIDSEGDPYLEMDVNLSSGGVSEANFAGNLVLWGALLDAFRKFINW